MSASKTCRTVLATAPVVIAALGMLCGCRSPALSGKAKAVSRPPVIYNLDCSEFFVGTFGPVAPGMESGMHPGTLNRTVTPEELRGIMLSAWHRNADAIYFFNLFTGPYQRWPRQAYDVPDQALSDGYNLIEVKSGADLTVTWVEIAVP